MTNRREFLKLGATASAVGLVSGPVAAKVAGIPWKIAGIDENLQNAGIWDGPLLKGNKDFSPITYEERAAVPSACWQCVTRCPMIGYVEDGKLVKIAPQLNSIRTHGTLCAKAQSGVNQVYDPDRILFPLRRVGARGEGKWKRISWDEALTELATRLKKLRDDGEPEKFMFHYGRMKASSSKLIKSVFLATYGTGTIGNHTAICEASKWVAQELTWGMHYDNWDVDNTSFVLNFGSNIFEAHTNHNPVAHRLTEALVKRGVRMVTFDVRFTNTAAKSSEWVPIKPGTDTAVVLAMCNVVMEEGLYQSEGEAFLRYCRVTKDVGATTDEKVAALKAHLAQYTPEWAEGISGVSAGKIRSIAREVALGRPSCIISYRGPIAHVYGVEGERAIQMLAAITGNIDNPGGRVKAVGASWKYPKGPADKPKSRKLGVLDGFEGQVALPTHNVSQMVLPVIRDGSAGRPEIYMWYAYQPVYSNGDCQFNIDTLKDESILPFTVAVSPFYDESSELADMILPDATYLERWDWEDNVSPEQVPEYYIRQPIVPPMGETRNFADVCVELAERMGFPLGVESMEEFVKQSCEMTPAVKAAGGFEYMKANGVYHDPEQAPVFFSYMREISPDALSADGVIFDETTQVYWNWTKSSAESLEAAVETGYAATKNSYKGYVGQRIGANVYRGFPPDKLNKSGYFEIYSEIMEEKGFNPMPSYIPNPAHAAMKPDELILTTYKVNVQTHSRTQNNKWLTEIYHENPAWINPETAAERGIANGDLITVRSDRGMAQPYRRGGGDGELVTVRSEETDITTRARVTPAVPPGVISISFHCGHWRYGRYASSRRTPGDVRSDIPDPDRSRVWWAGRNGVHPNWVMPLTADPIGGNMPWYDTVVTVEKAPAGAGAPQEGQQKRSWVDKDIAAEMGVTE
jgi:anaerobic selenocysteine-containing dehydrogenase